MMTSDVATSKPSTATRGFVYLVVASGAVLLFATLWSRPPAPPPLQWTLLLILTACSESFGIKLPALRARLTVSESFVFTSIFLFGTGPSIVLVLLDAMLVPLWQRRHKNVHQLLFNAFEPVVSVWIASEVFFRLSGIQPLAQAPAAMTEFLGPAVLVPVVYSLTNSSLTALAMGLEAGVSPLTIWRQHVLWLSLNCFVAASIAGLLVQNPRMFLGSFAMSLPILLVSYFVFRSSLGRVEDARRHVDELRRLYLSTIEGLAIAVDAKDQVTHGHIRRVQQFALGLARALDVRDEPTLRAIEAAGLLHDIGKLAIPDHILNKPGKLTTAEFEQMKLHATAGAQILSAIDFPFPVEPMVRHHHEQWNGKGYPAGLAGEEIPLGARILAVVDCFDALTSDRPYRRALSADEAIEWLQSQRAIMYDPRVVDTFARMHGELAATVVIPDVPSLVFGDIARSSGLPSIAARPTQGTLATDIDRPGESGREAPPDAADRIAVALRAVLAVSVVAVYKYAPSEGEVALVYQKGGPVSLVGCGRARGGSVTSWVAANRSPIVNGDPSIDLGSDTPASLKAMRSCLALPLVKNDEVRGVLMLYAEHEHAFDARALHMADSVTPYLVSWLERASTVVSRPLVALTA
jgi:putative nucleotidyltransferase with HDIG domain